MARSRNIKPGFFTNDELVELPFEYRLLFIGLWTIADREGRLLDRPKKIKMDVFPADNVDCEQGLAELEAHGFVQRYEVAGTKCVRIINWHKHQNPHIKESESTIPAPVEHGASLVLVPEIPVQAPEIPERAGLIPDSGFLIPDCLNLIPDTGFGEAPPPPAKIISAPPSGTGPKKRGAADTAETWEAYKNAYFNRYNTEPVRNASVNGKLAQFVARLGKDEAPHVAGFFVGHNNAYYVRQMHAVGALLSDAEKLRTEWATNSRMTQTKALQADRTETNMGAFAGLIEEARAREAGGAKW